MKNRILRGRAALAAMFKLIHQDRKSLLEDEQKRDLRETRQRQVSRQDEIFKHQERLDSINSGGKQDRSQRTS